MLKVKTNVGEVAFTFAHYRDIDVIIDNKRGDIITDATTCKVIVPGEKPVLGVATCSLYDNFDKDKGRKIALERALDSTTELAPLSTQPRISTPDRRAVRKGIWDRYHARRQSNEEYDQQHTEHTNHGDTHSAARAVPQAAPVLQEALA